MSAFRSEEVATPWRRRIGVAFLLAVAIAVISCRHSPAAAGPCHVPDQLACSGANHALVCDAGLWVEVHCRGQRGCAHRGDADECDDTIAEDGDLCPKNPPLDYACTTDGAKALVCKGGRFS